jgi:hypothetical protein
MVTLANSVIPNINIKPYNHSPSYLPNGNEPRVPRTGDMRFHFLRIHLEFRHVLDKNEHL